MAKRAEDQTRYSDVFNTETLQNDLKKRSINSGLYTFGADLANFVLRLGSISVLARILIPEYFGLVSMVTAVTVIAVQFKDMGLSLATVQQKEITHDQVSTLFWINLAVGVIMTAMLCGLAKFLAWFYGDNRLFWITIAIAMTFFWSGVTVQHQALLRRNMKYLKLAVINVGATVCSVVIAIGFAVKGYGYWALVSRDVSASIFVALATWVACPWIPGAPKRKTGIGRMVRFGRDITGLSIVTCFTDNLDQILLGKFYGPSLLGIYRQAYQLTMTPMSRLINPIQFVGQSTLSLLQDNRDKFRRYYGKILAMLTFVTMPLAAFLFVHSRDVILLVLGNKWIEGVVIFRIFSLALFIRPALSTVGLVMITCGETKKYFFLGLANSICIIIAIIIGLRWGSVGIAAGHVIENYFAALPIVYFGLRKTPVSLELFFRSVQPSMISSMVMGSVLFGFCQVIHIESSVNAIMLSLPIALIVYLATWAVIPGGNAKLREFIADFTFVFKKSGSRQASILS